MGTKNDKMVLKDYYNSLSEEAKKEFRESILAHTGMSLPSFYYKMRKGSWHKMEMDYVAKYLRQDVAKIDF